MASAKLQRYEALHKKALTVRPEPKPNTVTVVVFYDTEENAHLNIDDLENENFLWLRCSEKTTLQVIYKNCVKQWADKIVAPFELKLFFREAGVQMANSVGFLNIGGGDMVLLSTKLIDVSQQRSLPGIKLENSHSVPSITQYPAHPPGQQYSQYPQLRKMVKNEDYGFDHQGIHGGMLGDSHKNNFKAEKDEKFDAKGGDEGQESDDQKSKPATNDQLQQLFEDVDVKILEKGIEKGLSLLDKLKEALTSGDNGSEDIDTWVKQVEDIKKQAQYQRTIVGVVGNTGAGKSSVINALLDEERLVPTNCMRVCTAVVTEISYNHENNDLYRASIEFMNAVEWEKELRALFQDLMDLSGEIKNKLSAESVSPLPVRLTV